MRKIYLPNNQLGYPFEIDCRLLFVQLLPFVINMLRKTKSVFVLLFFSLLMSGCTAPLLTALRNEELGNELIIKEIAAVKDLNDPALVMDKTWTPLLLAVRHQDEKIVEILLAKGAKVDVNNNYKSTPLMLAAGFNSLKAVQLILAHGGDMSAVDNFGDGPLKYAVNYNEEFPEVAYYFLEHGPEPVVDKKSSDGWTLLHTACRYQRNGLPMEFIKRGFSAQAKTDNEWQLTPLMLAAGYNNLATVELLLAHGAKINEVSSGGWSPLMFAAKTQEDPQVVQTLLAHNADVTLKDSSGWTALMTAARYGADPAITKLILAEGADPDVSVPGSEQWYPLTLATFKGRFDHAAVLLHHGVNPKRLDETIYEDLSAAGRAYINYATAHAFRLAAEHDEHLGKLTEAQDYFKNAALYYSKSADDFSIWKMKMQGLKALVTVVNLAGVYAQASVDPSPNSVIQTNNVTINTSHLDELMEFSEKEAERCEARSLCFRELTVEHGELAACQARTSPGNVIPLIGSKPVSSSVVQGFVTSNGVTF